MQEKTYDLKQFLTNEDMLVILQHLDQLVQMLGANEAWHTVLVQSSENVVKAHVTFQELELILGHMVLSQTIIDRMPQDDENVIRVKKQLDAVTDKLREQYNAAKRENA